jgi:hypothetical protein
MNFEYSFKLINMKNRILEIILLVCAAALVSSCERDLETEGITTKITYYPVITLAGEQWNTIMVGETFSDPGVTAMEGDTEIDVVITGDVVDVNTPGVYTIEYTATNVDGYSATERRYVGVITPDVVGVDLTGAYKRTAGALGVSTVKKIGDGFYSSDNVGGVATPGPGTTVYFYHYEGNKLGVPPQVVAGSLFSCTNATVNIGVSYSWVVINSGYGTALRTFVKQ